MYTINKNQAHSYHLVTNSPWPIYASLAATLLTIGGVMYMHMYNHGSTVLLFGFIMLISVLAAWFNAGLRGNSLMVER